MTESADTVTTDASTTRDADDTTPASSDDTSEPPALCGDSIVAVGELCYDDVLVLETGDVTTSARFADVDDDGNQDVVYLLSDEAAVHLGDGTGAFGRALFAGNTPTHTHGEVGDVDGDGRLDLVSIESVDNSLAVLLADGAGGFDQQDPESTTGVMPMHLLVTDLDGLFGDEVLVGHSSGINVFVSDGDGTLQGGQGVALAGSLLGVGIGEFDGDGDRDLVFVREQADMVGIVLVLGDGDAAFGVQQVPVDSGGTDARAIASGDFNGDGNDDLVYVGTNLPTMYVQFGNGAASFSAASEFMTDDEPRRTLVLDVTSDGHDDVVVGHAAGHSLWIYTGDGAGGFADPLVVPLVGPVDSLGAGLANDDDVPDLIVTDGDGQWATVILSTP